MTGVAAAAAMPRERGRKSAAPATSTQVLDIGLGRFGGGVAT